MSAQFTIPIAPARNKRPAPPSEAGSDRTETQDDYPPDPQPTGTFGGVAEHKKQKRDGEPSEVASENSPEEDENFDYAVADGQWDYVTEGLQGRTASRVKAPTISSFADDEPDSDSDQSEGEEDIAVHSQISEMPEIVEYRGEECKGGNRLSKAKRLNEFYETTGEYLENYLEDNLCPTWPSGKKKGGLDWALDLIHRLVDLVVLCDSSAHFNALLQAEVGKRQARKYNVLPQVQKNEVIRVLNRMESKRERDEIRELYRSEE